MATIRTTGASLTNTVDINANNISLFDDNQNKYININEVYVNNSQTIESSLNGNKYEYPQEDISDHNVSGLQSMINYIKNNKKSSIYYYEDNSNFNIKKKINNSRKTLKFEENNIYNKITNTISHNIRNWNYEDNSNMYIRKQINRSKRYFNYDENTTLNKVNKTVKNNIYNNYSIPNIQANFLANKTIVNNNI